ncbi:hypothetical protein [Myxococcus qinghaiensis]|uniref:hypothetical protein n=1 Tax=Myxococcus qinghaiensis TaxID=2906758 RepID=UPI0020A7D68D|nr:hypothetical protein [Myxococcus qinghaiensis]MCP3169502.1 hypothetical protein [Myxococcus qinghaiensis]
MKRTILFSLLVTLGFSGEAAATTTGLRKILNLGCSTNDSTCWVEVEGAAAGPTGCSSTSLRWSTASANGKSILSLLTGAFLAGKQVRFEVTDGNCFDAQPMYPTFGYINFI